MKTTVKLWTVARDRREAVRQAKYGIDGDNNWQTLYVAGGMIDLQQRMHPGKKWKVYPVTLTIEVGEVGQPVKKGEE